MGSRATPKKEKARGEVRHPSRQRMCRRGGINGASYKLRQLRNGIIAHDAEQPIIMKIIFDVITYALDYLFIFDGFLIELFAFF